MFNKLWNHTIIKFRQPEGILTDTSKLTHNMW